MNATHTKSKPKAQAKPASSRRAGGGGKTQIKAVRSQPSKAPHGAKLPATAKRSAPPKPTARPPQAKAAAPRKAASSKVRASVKPTPRPTQAKAKPAAASKPQIAAGKSQPPPANAKKPAPAPAAKTPARATQAVRTPARHAPVAHVEPPQPAKAQADATRPKLSRQEQGELRHALVSERARLTGVVEGLREQSLTRHDEVNHEEDGTDAFIRLFDLDRASNEQSHIVRIDAAIRAIDEGTFGLCERCGCRIEKPRLLALPFVKTCIKCQSEAEHGHRGRVSARQRLWE